MTFPPFLIHRVAFPERLKAITSCPEHLYARGNVALLHTDGIAVVGTRNHSLSGEINAIAFTRGLVSYGFTVFSGLAFGIDAIAHETCLDYGGKTVAVLGNAIDRIHPACHESLALRILETGGLIVSEYGPGTPYRKDHFPARNRLLAGLTLATLVVEAPAKSGALITARRAFEQNRDVFAVPGALSDEKMMGNLNLIAENVARLVRSSEDIVGHLCRQLHLDLPAPRPRRHVTPKLETAAQQKVWAALSSKPLHTDEVLHRTGLPVVDVTVALSYLELRGWIREVGFGRFVRNP